MEKSLPAKRGTQSKPAKKVLGEPTPLQVLQNLQVSKSRAEKALASTGHQDARLALEWLLLHNNDPHLDGNDPREYILYACPTGPFQKELEKFWTKSQALFGWNGAHNFMPHITLVSFFKSPDENAQNLATGLVKAIERTGLYGRPLGLELYVSQNFIGFFVAEEDANYLKKLALQFAKEVSPSIIGDTYEQLDALVTCFPWCGTSSAQCIPKSSKSISLEPHVRSLHLTLAYQFGSERFTNLKEATESLDVNLPCEWEIRLYSRDARLETREVHEVVTAHVPRDPEELELQIGDYVYLAPDKTAPDDWVDGISWLTGQTGLVPKNFVTRIAESFAWTLHQRISLRGDAEGTLQLKNRVMAENLDKYKARVYKGLEIFFQLNPPTMSTLLSRKDSHLSSDSVSTRQYTEDGKRIYIMRHGERVDFTFGSWIDYSFDESGRYLQKDLNMPESLPKKKNGPESWLKDTPLTNMGNYQALLAGKSFTKAKATVSRVFCSPAFRCVQTCASFLEGAGLGHLQINVEPALFEWLAWYRDGIPDFLTVEELKDAGFNVNVDYEPLVSLEQLKTLAEVEDYFGFFRRNTILPDELAKQGSEGNALIVAHATNLDTSLTNLLGREARDIYEFSTLMHKVPYCSMAALAEKDGLWEIVEPPCLPLLHTNNSRFDWRVLNS